MESMSHWFRDTDPRRRPSPVDLTYHQPDTRWSDTPFLANPPGTYRNSYDSTEIERDDEYPSWQSSWQNSPISEEQHFPEPELEPDFVGRECMICCADIPEDDFPPSGPTSQCAHDADICYSCLHQYLEVEVQTGDINAIKCPEDSCRSHLSHSDMRQWAPSHIFQRYDELLLRQAMSKLPEVRFCKNYHCQSAQEHLGGADQPIMRCEACGAKACFTHDVEWHEGLTCAQYNRRQKKQNALNVASARFIEKQTKKCPNCSVNIQKNDGCDHMVCRKPGGCGFEFCWSCLAPYQVILLEGNHRHAIGCVYYTPNAGSSNAPPVRTPDIPTPRRMVMIPNLTHVPVIRINYAMQGTMEVPPTPPSAIKRALERVFGTRRTTF